MSYICLPHDFDERTGECKSFQIVINDGGDLTPVGYLRGPESPVELARFSDNVVSALNNNKPLYRLGPDHQMFYEPYEGGANFRFRSRDGGVSETGVMLTFTPGRDIAIAPSQFKAIGDTVGVPERRDDPNARRTSSDSRKHAPRRPGNPRPSF